MKILLLLFPIMFFSQVGINTTEPTNTLDVNGSGRFRDMPTVTTAKYMIVADDDGVLKKMVQNSTSGKCPRFLRSESSGHSLKFDSDSSIPKPNDPLVISGINFTSSGSYIQHNTYIYQYSNTSGQALNITSFTVNFSGMICNY